MEPTFSENDIETDQSLIQTSIYLDYLYTSLQSQNHSRNADIFAEINLILKNLKFQKEFMIFIYQNSKKVMTVILKT